MKSITFVRPNEHFNKSFSYEIWVHGKLLTSLRSGDENRIEIPSELENASAQAKLQWCGSNHFDLSKITADGILEVSGNKFLNRTLPLVGIMFPLSSIILFNMYTNIYEDISIGIIGILMVGMIGTLTIGRNKWLRIRKI